MPNRLGWTGAAGDAGTAGSTQRKPGIWQASWPMLAVYASTNLAPLAPAWVASMALRFFSTPRRYGTSSGVIGSWGQQPGPLSGRIARYGTTLMCAFGARWWMPWRT